MGFFDFLYTAKTTDNPEAKKNLNKAIIKNQLLRIKQDTASWREAVEEAERAFFPHRVQMQTIFLDTILNGHVLACMEKRRGLTLLRDYEFLNSNQEVDEKVTELFNKSWFDRVMYLALDSIFYGYNLIALGDIKNNDFVNPEVIKRWNVSPDRLIVAQQRYANTGISFIEDEEIKKFHLYVSTPNDTGISKCGYGILYTVAVYEIFLRNILGYNGDFVELFSQPFRVGKTDKTELDEANLFEQAVKEMGSSGYAILDSLGNESIEFISSDNSSNGFLGYDNFEARLEKKISKIILGHADALDSTAGKLGSGNDEDSPSQIAMKEKQAIDGKFIENVINFELFPRMRDLGFNLPEGTKFRFKDTETKNKRNFRLAVMAEQMKKAGFQMDKYYFEENTSIKTQEITGSVVKTESPVLNKLKAINALYKG